MSVDEDRGRISREEDVRFLLRLLEIRSYERALAVITRYYPIERFPQKTLHALEELRPKGRHRSAE